AVALFERKAVEGAPDEHPGEPRHQREGLRPGREQHLGARRILRFGGAHRRRRDHQDQADGIDGRLQRLTEQRLHGWASAATGIARRIFLKRVECSDDTTCTFAGILYAASLSRQNRRIRVLNAARSSSCDSVTDATTTCPVTGFGSPCTATSS